MATRVNRRNLEATSGRIFSQARAVFADRGLEGARIDRIAARADVSKAMIYYLYPSKEDLYKAVLAGILKDLSEAVRNEISRVEFKPQDIKQLIRIYFDIFAANVDVARIMLREFANGAPIIAKLKEEHPEYFMVFAMVIDRMYEYIDRGELRPIPAERYLLALISLAPMLIALHPHSNLLLERVDGKSYKVSLDEWRELIVELFMSLVLSPE